MDLREQLQATYDELSGAAADPVPAPAPAAAPEPVAPAETSAEAAPVSEGAVRDEHGRFKAKQPTETAEAGAAAAATPAAPEPEQPETAPPEDKEPQSEAIRVPPSLPAAVKAKFKDLDPDVQTAFVKLEDSVQTAKAEWGKKGGRLNRYDEIIGPHLDKWRVSGLDEFSGIQALIAAQNILERNPVAGLVHIARSYGVDLRSLAGQAAPQQSAMEGQRAPTMTPELQAYLNPLMQQVQALQQQVQQSHHQTEAQRLGEAQAEIQTFMSDPRNLYFENVREDIARFLDTGAANTLQEAYDRAVWASPEIRPLLIAEQTKQSQSDQAERARQDAERRKAQAAQQAAGSITGAPAPGAQAPAGPHGSIRDSLEAAARQVGYRA